MGCVSGGQETEYRELVDRVVTKKMVVDFRRTRTKLYTFSILREDVEEVKGLKMPRCSPGQH